MRVRVDVGTDVPTLRWEDVHGPARGVMYELLAGQDPMLAKSLHENGPGSGGTGPLGVAIPQFRGAASRNGVYTTSQDGSIWMGSPIPEIAGNLVSAISARREIRWGAALLKIKGFAVDMPLSSTEKTFELITATPVVLRDGARYLLPDDDRYTECLRENLERKADFLGLPPPLDVGVVAAGPRRRMVVKGTLRVGARLRVRVEADPRLVEALRSWGLGMDTIQGFGWIR
ncbi:CRISPR-associated endoribonuclease Cas6 [Streptomyces sp. NPDC005438]|uniref:CRISPR-associated endoribonuclease Cas6 n=1 Tax=Streptomyces sp. NPDC005438 TaxID=3156880 RepID=UPI0033A884E3